MSDSNEETADERARVEVQVPVGMLARLHEQYPEARDENATAVLVAAGDGLQNREAAAGEG
jgi:tellurite resistance protein